MLRWINTINTQKKFLGQGNNHYQTRRLDHNTMQFTKTVVAALSLTTAVAGDLVSYRACQAGCTQVVRACYAAYGFTFGTVVGANAPASILASNTVYGSCQSYFALLARHY